MDLISDTVFGELSFNGSWTKDVELTFLGVTSIVELIVEGNDDNESILDEQRDSFRKLKDFISMAEDAVFAYYQSVCDDYRSRYGDEADARMPVLSGKTGLSALTELTGVVVPMVMDSGEISIGFLPECSWDPEHGLGVKIINGQVEVGAQDLLT
ncbi:MAG: hypothetical protein KDA79_09115 [Planctomycetaceae bacterium]|nr:hypothetical protein [Planctomycetaceae bacterium]